MRLHCLTTSSAHPIFILSLLTLSLLIAACSQTPISSIYGPDKALPTRELPPPPEQWAIKAKLGIRTEDDSGSVTLNWVQKAQTYTIHLQGALGQANALISGNSDYIIIEQAGKAPLYATDANLLILNTFGWNLPIANFSYWIRGIANPEQGVESLSFNESGTLNSLEQSLWKIDYSRYQTVEKWQLPGRIRASRDGVQLTLIIREWQVL